MKKILLLAFLITSTIVGYAQVKDVFRVGPYIVTYYGDGEYTEELGKDINLYEFFNLKKDTVFIDKIVLKRDTVKINKIVKPETRPFKSGLQADLFMSLPLYTVNGAFVQIGVGAGWKHKIYDCLYLNGGLSLGFFFGTYNTNSRKDSMFELGIPLSIEYANIDYKKASLYAGVGFVPTIYATMSASEKGNDEPEKESGFFVTPRVDLGGYIPVDKYLLKIGVYGEYKINGGVYQSRIGRATVGANVGLIF